MPKGIKTQETRLKLSISSKANWGNPLIRANIITGMQASITPEVCKKRSDNAKSRWADPLYKQRVTESIRSALAKPEIKSKMLEAARLRCDTKSWKLKTSDRLISEWKNEKYRLKKLEGLVGGFWYGNVRYNDSPQYCHKFTNSFKERVRAYRGYKCFECGITDYHLHVHHVHYDKQTCCNGSPHDIVPLCNSCHSSTNGNRDYWESHFTQLIYAMHSEGKCFFSQSEMKTFISTHAHIY